MASAVYPSFKQALLNGEINLPSDVIKVALVTSAVNTANTVVGDVTRVGTDQTLTTKTITSGVFKADPSTWTAVAAGSTVIGAVFWDDTTATDKLICYVTLTSFLTNDGNTTITWDAAGIFAV